MSDGIARFKDFTGDTEPITFKIHDQVFTAYEDIPLQHLAALTDITKEFQDSTGSAGDSIDKMIRLFEKFLIPESFEVFKACVMGEGPVVIGVSRIKDIIPWLLEQYGLRPTEASSSSSNTLSETGASLTAGV